MVQNYEKCESFTYVVKGQGVKVKTFGINGQASSQEMYK